MSGNSSSRLSCTIPGILRGRVNSISEVLSTEYFAFKFEVEVKESGLRRDFHEKMGAMGQWGDIISMEIITSINNYYYLGNVIKNPHFVIKIHNFLVKVRQMIEILRKTFKGIIVSIL